MRAMKRMLGFFGAGKMAEGIVQAVKAAGTFTGDCIVMAEKSPQRAREMAKRYGVNVTPAATDVASKAGAVFLAVRPQDVAELAAQVKPLLTAKSLVVSIVAGKSLATLRKMFGAKVRLVRVMPNLALRANEGMCAICPAKNATKADVKLVTSILGAAGQTVVDWLGITGPANTRLCRRVDRNRFSRMFFDCIGFYDREED